MKTDICIDEFRVPPGENVKLKEWLLDCGGFNQLAFVVCSIFHAERASDNLFVKTKLQTNRNETKC